MHISTVDLEIDVAAAQQVLPARSRIPERDRRPPADVVPLIRYGRIRSRYGNLVV